MTTGNEAIIVCAEDVQKLRGLLASSGGRDEEVAEQLESELDRATVLPRAGVPSDVVIMGSTVEFEDANTHQRRLIELVYPAQADPSKGRISVMAPVGTALLGLRVGQSLDWPVPKGQVRVRILRVVHSAQEPPSTPG